MAANGGVEIEILDLVDIDVEWQTNAGDCAWGIIRVDDIATEGFAMGLKRARHAICNRAPIEDQQTPAWFSAY